MQQTGAILSILDPCVDTPQKARELTETQEKCLPTQMFGSPLVFSSINRRRQQTHF